MIRAFLHPLAIGLAGVLAAPQAAAQVATASTDTDADARSAASTAAAQAPAPVRPDIEFGATLHMDSIRFAGPPKASVTITGGPNVVRRHEVGRGGLPLPVPIGRTFRDITVHTTISATLLDPSIEADAQLQVGTPAPASPPNDTPEDAP
ncbi:hypothetical protein [Lysobacter humi (ex Lee et al. 2017)]